MKAALLVAPFRIKIEDTEEPSPGADEVLIKVKATGICASDLHAYRGTHPFRTPPVVLGHELAGEVEKVGDRVQKIRPGDSVTVEPWTHCGRCTHCLYGKYNLCSRRLAMGTTEWQGSFAEYVVAPEDSIYKLPEELSFEEGALVEPLAVSVHVARETEVELGKTVVILGAGTIGLGILACLRASGAGKIIVTDVEISNLRMATDLGASEVVNVKERSIEEVVNEATEGKGMDIAVIAVGEENLVQEASRIVKKGGRIVIPAIFDKLPEVDMFKIVYGEQNIQGSWGYTGKDFDIAIDLMALGKVNLKRLITDHFSLDDAEKAFRILDKRGEKVIKILFTF
jgi:L-iditol 2-dehydrogenase